MDKNAIKKYAVWARRELIERVSQRAMIYGITAKDAGDPNAESVNGHLLSRKEKRQRQALIRNIKAKGYEQVMEEVAYTWFNRFAALRFMEVNGYLPSHIRVFTNDAGEFKPQILAEAIHLELDGLDMNKVYELESANKSEELFKYLLIVQCNALNSILPGMFQRIDDYTELLLPDYLLREGSVIEQMATSIPEEDWTDQVQIIGWLYEAYNTDLNTLVYDGTLSKKKIPKELVSAATTIFTPDWPVHYMVENSLGRLWLEGHPNDELKTGWKYYLDEAEQKPEVQAQLTEIRKQYNALKPEEILTIDPCAGSGHILCVLFDTLVQIYEDYGYSAREAAVSIVQHNLWGLDINDRAAQLAYFAVMMKARQYDRRFFAKEIQPHIYAIQESNGINRSHLDYLGYSLSDIERNNALNQMNTLLDEFIDAKEYGSILQPREYDWALLSRFVEDTTPTRQISLGEVGLDATQEQLRLMIAQGQALTLKYHVVVTNPPYLGSNRFGVKLDTYVKTNWPDVKSDLSMVMYQHALRDMVNENGFVSFITTTSWMFLSSFEKLRSYTANNATLSSLVDYGTELFDGKVGHNPIVSWVIRKVAISGYKMISVRLVEFCYSRRDQKEPEFLSGQNRYTTLQDNFSKIPSAPIAYWASENLLTDFSIGTELGSIAYPRQGMATTNNDRFLRQWYEVSKPKIGFGLNDEEETESTVFKWFPYNKGGEYRKWYGNNDYVVNFQNKGTEICDYIDSHSAVNHKGRVINRDRYFKPSVTWSKVSSGNIAFRYKPNGFIFDVAGTSIFGDEHTLLSLMGFLNSKVTLTILACLSPTLNYEVGHICSIPVLGQIFDNPSISRIVEDNRRISAEDWDSFETSWDFREHPFITSARWAARNNEAITIRQAFVSWKGVVDGRFRRLKENEEELNHTFIDIYGLGEELSSEVEDKDVTIRRADLQREVRSFISYAVGCMFGRYSLGEPGLIYAGGEWDVSKYPQFQPDKDAIIPICDDEYFEDDIVGRFVTFVEKAFGKEVLEENLRDIADALGGKGSPREVIRNYFINDFYTNHLKVYQKRPIYWLFDSGKKNGFKCLIYMHRYQPDTIARIRTDYVHEQQSRYRTAIVELEQRINGASTSERVKLSKQLTTLRAQAEEIRIYEEKIHHLADQMIKIDLDDGVKHNYAIFKDVLAKIK